jgi:hypothetical protein
MTVQTGVDILLYSFFNLGARCGWVLMLRSGRFTPGKDPVRTVQEAGWVPGAFWISVENLALTGIQSLDCPARTDYALPA